MRHEFRHICGSQRQRTDLWLPKEVGVASEKWTGSLRLADVKLLYLEWINNKVLLYNIGNCIQSAGINHSRKEFDAGYRKLGASALG